MSILLLGAAPPPFLHAVADGVYVHTGQIALNTPENLGDIANLTVIVGADAVAVIDTGGSVAVGRALRNAVATITDRPIRYVINTHEHPDHLFGNAAFADIGATFVGHRDLPRELAERGDHYLRSYRAQIGDRAVEAVRLIPPTLTVDDRTTLDLGGGRTLVLTAWSPPAHTGCDLTVLDTRTGTLVAGDLLFVEHVPIVDASARGWLTVLDGLEAILAVRAIPGHGPDAVAWPAAAADERRYLTTLLADSRDAVSKGTPLEKAVPMIAAAERARWKLFDEYNARNATATYVEVEWE